MKKYHEIELRSDVVKEIMTTPPKWIVRNGIIIILVIVFISLTGSYFYKYPDIISARIVVLSSNPPVHLVSRSSGIIDKIFIEENQVIKKGEAIATIENTGDYEAICRLKQYLDGIDDGSNFNTIPFEIIESNYVLGDIQPYYSSYFRLYKNYIQFLNLGFYPHTIASLNEQLKIQQDYISDIQGQIDVLAKEFEIAKEQFHRDSVLYSKKVLSLDNFKKSKLENLHKEYALRVSKTDMTATKREILLIKQSIIDNEKEYKELTQQYNYELKESLDVLKSELELWSQKYVISTPIKGRVSFTNIWSENQYVKNGDIVCSVIPVEHNQIIGKVVMPIIGAGKVKVGQRVNIKFDNYPYVEYGMLVGKIKSISLVPANESYIAEIELPQDLITNYGRELTFLQEMQGSAEIITDDLRLLQRFFNPFRFIYSEKLVD